MPKVPPPLPEEKDALIQLARGIVLAQGNAFIKELLRERGIRIGVTKAEFEQNMLAAIQSGELQREHIESWLNEVEGWGDQHVYIYTIPSAVRKTMRDPTAMEQKVKAAGLLELWNKNLSLDFPRQRTLSGINLRNGELVFVWHQGKEFAIRRKEMDRREDINGDLYEFRAYRIRSDRSVTRFVARPGDGLAAIFVQTAWEEDEHKALIRDVRDVVNRVVPFDDLQHLVIEKAIKKFDDQALNKAGVIAQATRLSAAGAYVEFVSTSSSAGYQDIGPVRDVRRAVQPRSFKGTNGNFLLQCGDSEGEMRRVRVQLYGEERRVRLTHQMTASEVWSVIEMIRANV
ncbi:MAG TPA: hypothetical protein VK578_13805 [Edaphobacter sp.]|nr:hypothetical protein [Edaphobacter sp.]